jgi:hypothetical protein
MSVAEYLPLELLSTLLTALCTLLKDRAREVVEATLTLLRVLLFALPINSLASFTQLIVSGVPKHKLERIC